MSETNNNKPKMNMPRFNLSWLYMFIAMTIAYLYFTSDDNGGVNRELTYTEFKDMVSKGYASKIIAYNDNTVDLFIKPEHVKDVFKDDYKKVGRSPSVHVEVVSESFPMNASNCIFYLVNSYFFGNNHFGRNGAMVYARNNCFAIG